MDTSAADASHVNDNVGATKVSGGPIPMSFPAILRNPALSSRFAHLQEPKERSKLSSAVARNKSGTQKEGRRWVRRLDNARFAANPHITLPTARDHVLPLPHKRMTFPEPLPSYLPRTCSAPTPTLPPSNPASTYAGHFSHSLKGVRRNLRKSNKARGLVKVVESELLAWLDDASVLVNPQLQGSSGAGKALDSQGIVREISRTVGQMIWAISDDGFARYIVHCVARWYGVVSFSKDSPEFGRLTHLLRPNVTRPNLNAVTSVDTPPGTDLDYSSHGFDTEESDFVSESDVISEIDEYDVIDPNDLDGPQPITERSDSGLPSGHEVVLGDDDTHGGVGSADPGDSVDSLDSRTRFLSIGSEENESTAAQRSRLARIRTRTPRRALRSASSPSPIRRFPLPRREPAPPPITQPHSAGVQNASSTFSFNSV